MKVADKVSVAYLAAQLNGLTDRRYDAADEEMGRGPEVSVPDPDGKYSCLWSVYVTVGRQQRAWLYIPATGEERCISAHEAELVILGVRSHSEVYHCYEESWRKSEVTA